MVVDLIAGTMAIVGIVMAAGAAAVLAAALSCRLAVLVTPSHSRAGRALRRTGPGARQAAAIGVAIGATAIVAAAAGALLVN